MLLSQGRGHQEGVYWSTNFSMFKRVLLGVVLGLQISSYLEMAKKGGGVPRPSRLWKEKRGAHRYLLYLTEGDKRTANYERRDHLAQDKG